jgi:hypothetical protein
MFDTDSQLVRENTGEFTLRISKYRKCQSAFSKFYMNTALIIFYFNAILCCW